MFSPAPASSTHSLEANIELLTNVAQVCYAILLPVAYWLAVAAVVVYHVTRFVSPIVWDIASAFVSDQMGYTSGFSIETINKYKNATKNAPNSAPRKPVNRNVGVTLDQLAA